MIAPEGYYPFSALLSDALGNSLYEEAENYLVDTCNSVLALATGRRDDLVRRWVFDYCGRQIFACSPEGAVMHIDEKVLSHNGFYVDITSRVFAGDEFDSVPEKLRKDFFFLRTVTKVSHRPVQRIG